MAHSKIKMCGITDKKDALAASSFGAWAIGFIFYKKSPRYIEPKKAAKIIEALPKSVIPVGVFVDAKEDEIKETAKFCKLKAIQFHGKEMPSFCQKFKEYKTIKAFRVKAARDFKGIKKYKTDFYLFDTFKKDVFGGTGSTFDWSILKGIPSKNIILSGGLNPKNIAQALCDVKAFAYDVSSGVERRPGKKCQRLLKKLFREAEDNLK